MNSLLGLRLREDEFCMTAVKPKAAAAGLYENRKTGDGRFSTPLLSLLPRTGPAVCRTVRGIRTGPWQGV